MEERLVENVGHMRRNHVPVAQRVSKEDGPYD